MDASSALLAGLQDWIFHRQAACIGREEAFQAVKQFYSPVKFEHDCTENDLQCIDTWANNPEYTDYELNSNVGENDYAARRNASPSCRPEGRQPRASCHSRNSCKAPGSMSCLPCGQPIKKSAAALAAEQPPLLALVYGAGS